MLAQGESVAGAMNYELIQAIFSNGGWGVPELDCVKVLLKQIICVVRNVEKVVRITK